MHEVNYQRHVDGTDQLGDGQQPHRRRREIHIPFLPERYEPLVDEEERVKLKEERRKRKKRQYKKVRKVSMSFHVLQVEPQKSSGGPFEILQLNIHLWLNTFRVKLVFFKLQFSRLSLGSPAGLKKLRLYPYMCIKS